MLSAGKRILDTRQNGAKCLKSPVCLQPKTTHSENMDTLFEIEPTTPKWRELMDLHGIECHYIESGHLPPIWRSKIDWYGDNEYEQAETEREAVITLIHRLQLEGWKTISL